VNGPNAPTGIPNFEWRAAAAGLKPLAAARPCVEFSNEPSLCVDDLNRQACDESLQPVTEEMR